jgi:hypothetical protein
MAEWSEDHVAAIGPFKTSNSNLVDRFWINWRPDGPLGGKGMTIDWEGRRVVCGKSAPSRLYPPPMLVKDRLVDPCEQVLDVPIAYWFYGPSKLM